MNAKRVHARLVVNVKAILRGNALSVPTGREVWQQIALNVSRTMLLALMGIVDGIFRGVQELVYVLGILRNV